MRQVWILIRHVIAPIQGLPNPTRQVVTLVSHIRTYPPHQSHPHAPSLSFSSTTQTSSQNTKSCYPSLSLNAMIMSWHRVQHTPSTAYTEYHINWVPHTSSPASTQDCSISLHSHDQELTPECSFSFQHTSLHDRPPSAGSPSQPKGNVTLSHSHHCKLTNWWIESRHPAHHASTSTNYSSNLAQSRPPSASPNSLYHGLQVSTITASKCISKLAPLRPPSASLSTVNLGLQVHVRTRSITASKSISRLARSWHPSASTYSLHYSLQVRTIVPSMWISQHPWLRPPSLHDHGLQVHLQTRSIMASKLAQSRPQSASPNSPDTISECICKFPRSGPPGLSLNTLDYRLKQASPMCLDHSLGVYLWVHSIVIFRHSLNCSQAPPAASPAIPCVDG